MANQQLYLVSPPGRIIMGDLTSVDKTDHLNNLKPENQWNKFFAIAIPKSDPNVGNFLNAVQQHAAAGYQQNAAVMARVQQGLGSGFSWKIDDGDAVDAAGSHIVKNDHARGCFVVKFSTTLLDKPEACSRENQPIDPAIVKRGYWVDVAMSTSINGKPDNTAGIYINPNTVRLLGYDDEITSGPSAEQQFANAPAANVGSQTPVSPGGTPGGMQGGQAQTGGGMGHGSAGMTAGTPPAGMGATAGTPPNPQATAGAGVGMPGMGGNPPVNPHHGIMDSAQGQAGGYAYNGMPGMGG